MLVIESPLLLFLLLVPVVLAVLTARLAAVQSWSQRRLLVMILRCVALAVLIIAVAQPAVKNASAKGALTFIVDTSDSISPADRAAEADWLQRAASTASTNNPVRVITFAATASAVTVYAPLSHDTIQRMLRPHSDGAQTNLAGALRLAAGLAPSGSRLVLLTDGVQTAGDAQAVLGELTAQHLTLSTFLLSHPLQPDVALTRLALSSSAPAGVDLPLQITMHSTLAVTTTLVLQVDGQELGRQALALHAGDNPYLISVPPQTTGWHVVRASVTTPGDLVPENNVLTAVTDVTHAPRVLLVTAQPGNNIALSVLTGQAGKTTAVTPQGMPSTAAKLAQYDTVVLDDLPAAQLSAKQVAALNTVVRQLGVGLFVLGGTHSLTLGHYSQTALERMLPVISNTPASLQDGNVALQLVLDRSGSMDDLAGDVPKIVMSRAAAHLAADFTIQHKDDLGILSFDQVSRILVPMGKTSPGSATGIHKIINGMFSDGGTNIYSGLQLGIEQVSRSNAPYHHIILMTDGRSDPANYAPLIQLAQQRKVTISTVALGPDADIQLLHYIAAAGKGRFYYTTNARDLPHIFAEESRLSAGSAAVTGNIGVRISANSPTIRSLGAGPLTHLGGYTATVLKPGAINDLETNIQVRKPDPLLSRWQYGLGRVLVWTPGLENAWSAPWRRTQTAFWTDALRWTFRGAGVPAFAPSIANGTKGSAIQIDTLRNSGVANELQRLTVDIHAPGGATSQVTATQIGPGLYQAPYQFDAPGVYSVSVNQLAGTGSVANTLVAVPYSREYLPAASNGALLATLSSATGGVSLQNIGQLAALQSHAGTQVDLWWALALLALALFVAAIAIERLANPDDTTGR